VARPLFIGNGSMLVGMDHTGLVHDFYYPYVGQENHANENSMHHRIGVWVDDKFSWVDDGSWKIRIDYEPDAMIGHITATNDELQVALELHDFVDHEYNAFCRNIHVVNNADREREVRVFMHQVFRISESQRGDTAMYVPDGNYILDYKDKRSFLIYGEQPDGSSFDQYSVGIHGIEGQAGTYQDAIDGELSNNAVEHGSVDSTIRFTYNLPATSSKRLHYWIVAATSHADAVEVHQSFLGAGFRQRYEETQAHWKKWLSQGEKEFRKLGHDHMTQFKKSMLIMKSHMDRRGGIIASGDSEMLNYARDNYSYCWPRDSAYVLWPLIRLGYTEEPRAFFEFARDVLSENGSLMHKYQPDRAVGSTWHPLVHKGKPELAIQEDETAIVIFMLHQYLLQTDDDDFVSRFYASLVKPAATFLENFIDESTRLPHASYDLWEEKFLTSTYTVAVTYAGLKAASKIAEKFEHPDDAIRWQTVADEIRIASSKRLFNEERGYFYKGFLLENEHISYDEVIDVSSLYGALMFGLFDADSHEVTTSLTTLENTLLNKSPAGGLPRYEYDNYCRINESSLGNPWFVTTLWLAQMYIELGMKEKAIPIIEWTQAKMLKSGVLSEQINADTNEFMSVVPLIWSQAEFINTLLDVSD
jgi:GH15 family glucan-1,4-alpha-glucosidase